MLAHIRSIRKCMYKHMHCISRSTTFFLSFHSSPLYSRCPVHSIASTTQHQLCSKIAKRDRSTHCVEHSYFFLMSICDAVLRQFVVSVLIRFVFFCCSVLRSCHAVFPCSTPAHCIFCSIVHFWSHTVSLMLSTHSVSFSSFSLHFNSVSAIQRPEQKPNTFRCCWLSFASTTYVHRSFNL